MFSSLSLSLSSYHKKDEHNAASIKEEDTAFLNCLLQRKKNKIDTIMQDCIISVEKRAKKLSFVIANIMYTYLSNLIGISIFFHISDDSGVNKK